MSPPPSGAPDGAHDTPTCVPSSTQKLLPSAGRCQLSRHALGERRTKMIRFRTIYGHEAVHFWPARASGDKRTYYSARACVFCGRRCGRGPSKKASSGGTMGPRRGGGGRAGAAESEREGSLLHGRQSSARREGYGSKRLGNGYVAEVGSPWLSNRKQIR